MCVRYVRNIDSREYAQSKVNWNQKESDDDTVEWKKTESYYHSQYQGHHAKT